MRRSILAGLALAAAFVPPGALAQAGSRTAGAAPYRYACAQSLASNQAAANEQLRQKYELWRASRVSYEGPRARVKADPDFTYFDDGGSERQLPHGTISEGHAYGMLLAAYMGDRRTFDALEAYRYAHRNAKGAMPWVIRADGVVADSGAASDADQDMAFALLVAHRRWSGYQAPLTELLATIRTHMVVPEGSAHAYLLTAGDMPLQWWEVTFPGSMAPAWYRAFATWTDDSFWTEVAEKSYQYLTSIDLNPGYGNAATGLLPDRSRPDGTLDPDPESHRFSWNAVRAPWRLATDAAWNCEPRASSRAERMNAFFAGGGPGRGPTGIGTVYRTSGAFLDDSLYGGPDRSPWFYGPLTSAAMLSTNGGYRQGMWMETVRMTDFSRYGHELGLLGLLLAGGGMHDPLADPRRTVDDFESGNTARWWTYADSAGSTLGTAMVWPAAVGHGVRVTYGVVNWAGFGVTLNESWSGFRALEVWMEGTGSGNPIYLELEDADGELFAHRFVDDFTGWRFASVPLNTTAFPRRRDYQPATVDNGMTLTNVRAIRFQPWGRGSFGLDRLVLVP
jgi:hypothetical protein